MARLRLVVAKFTFIQTMAPSLNWTMEVGGPAATEFARVWEECGGRYVGPRGRPNRELVEQLDKLVGVLQERLVKEESYRALRTAVLRQHPSAKSPLDRLTASGANPWFILRDCLRFEIQGVTIAQDTASQGRRRREVRRLARAARQSSRQLEDILKSMGAHVGYLGLPSVQHRWPETLRSGGSDLARLEKTCRQIEETCASRMPQQRTNMALDLIDHVQMTTGKPRIPLVAQLLIATGTLGRERGSYDYIQVANRLDQLRHQRKGRGKTSLTEWVDLMITPD